MLGWITYQTITRDADGETVEGDIGFITPYGEHVSHDGIIGDQFIDLQHSCAHVVTLIGDINDQVLAAVDWVRERIRVIDHLDVRTDGTIIAYEADLGDVGDDVPYVHSVIIRTSPFLQDGIVRALEGR